MPQSSGHEGIDLPMSYGVEQVWHLYAGFCGTRKSYSWAAPLARTVIPETAE